MQNPEMLYELNRIHLAELRSAAAAKSFIEANNESRANILSRLVKTIRHSESTVNRKDVMTTQELRTFNVIR